MKAQILAVSVLLSISLLTGCQSSPAMGSAVEDLPSSAAVSEESSSSLPSSSKVVRLQAQSGEETGNLVTSSSQSSLAAAAPTVYRQPSLDCVSESAQAEPSFLEHAVFVGDSVTLKLKNYVTKKRKSEPGYFGTASFLTAGSMGSGNALKPLGEDSIHPYYNGEKALLEDSAAKIGAKKIYLMLGINDVAPYGVQGAADNLEKLTQRFCDKISGVTVYIQSATPMLANKQKKTLNNANLDRYNELVSKICEKHGWYFLNVASVMKDSTGALKKDYCSDPDDLGLHFTDAACEVWVHYILTHTGG